MTDVPHTSKPERLAVDLDTAIMRATLERWLCLQGERARRDEPYRSMDNWYNEFISELSVFAKLHSVSEDVIELFIDNEHELRELVGSGWCAEYVERVAAGDYPNPSLQESSQNTLAHLSSFRHAAEPVVGLHPQQTLHLRRDIAASIAESKEYVRLFTDKAITEARSSAKVLGSMPIAEEAVALSMMLAIYALSRFGKGSGADTAGRPWSELVNDNFIYARDELLELEEVSDPVVKTIIDREPRVKAFAEYAKGVLAQVDIIDGIDDISELEAYVFQQRRNMGILLTSHRRDLPWSNHGELAVMIRKNLFSPL